MKILVIGGSGFIGSHVCDALLAFGHKICVYDKKPELFRSPLPNVEYIIGSLEDRAALSDLVADSDCIVHLASTTVPATSNQDPLADIQSNLGGTVSLLELMKEVGARRIVFLSSGGSVYGDPEQNPVSELCPLRPMCSYAIVKIAIEHYLSMYQKLYGIEYVVLRACNPYGPRQSLSGIQGIISTFLINLKNNKPLEIWGDGEVVRDYFYVSDLAELCAKAVNSSAIGIFNAGSGIGTSINRLVYLMGEVTGLSPDVCYRTARGYDVKKIFLNIEKSQSTFDWSPRIELREGIHRLWEWLRDQ